MNTAPVIDPISPDCAELVVITEGCAAQLEPKALGLGRLAIYCREHEDI